MAVEFTFKDKDMAAVKGKSVIITGCSYGIGLATAKLLLDLGASTDVGVWNDLVNLFKTTHEKYGRIDQVLANAGIGPSADYFSDTIDDDGDLIELSSRTHDITFKGNVNTGTLAIYYKKKQPEFSSKKKIIF
ncbi:levodione reductase [Fusarium beomiforme]|uniref:Levodione reductase n=1 Tax=Fusarium beomiforme TaxID=44412 RepID=A0A9P5AEE0_9HYPO|nr:levodione reductase [Fusarium beomiforme]